MSAKEGPSASPSGWRAPACARAATPSAGSPTAASRSTARCWRRRPSSSPTPSRIEVDGKPLPRRRPRAAVALSQAGGRAGDGARSARAGRTIFDSPAQGHAARRHGRPARLHVRGPAAADQRRRPGAPSSSCRPTAGSRRYRARVHGPRRRGAARGARQGHHHRRRALRRRSRPGSTASSAPTPGSSIALTEGKNREVRRVLAHLDLPVMRLIRIAFGPFHLGELRARPGRRGAGAGARQPAGRQAAAAQGRLGQAQPRSTRTGSGGTDAQDRRRQASRPRA